ncbi:MAG: serine/threonine-protein kinase [Dokdonella sp.]
MTSKGYLAEHFERLCELPPETQRGEIDALALGDDDKLELTRLLAADRGEGDPIRAAIGDSAANIHHPLSARFGAWRLVREIGAGGMGTVFLAERVEGQFDQQVAIKLLRGFPTSDSMRRLRQERQILAGLDHPNIARLLDGGETDAGQPWLAMEYVDGYLLVEYVHRHASTMRERLALFDAMLGAIEHAHQHLIIHRDLKPANVLVTDSGMVKLLDFGIARLIAVGDRDQGSTSTRVFSRGYASPEQEAGGSITTASDIYSLGVMLRELLTGERAPGDQRDPLVEPLKLDAEMAGIIAKATSSKSEDRYSAASEFRDDLDRYREGRPVRAASMTRRYRLRKFVGRHRVGSLLSVTALAVLMAFVWRLDRERNRAVHAETTMQQALAASERDARSARAALHFLTDAFSAASPDSALSTQVRVRDLLDAARSKLEARDKADASFAQPIQRLLGTLYLQLGEAQTARDLLRDGLAGVEPADPAEALRLADDYEDYSAVLGLLEQGEASQAAAQTASGWREQFASSDVTLRIRSLQMLAMVSHRSGKDDEAIVLLHKAYRLGAGEPAVAADVRIESAQLLASLLATHGDCEEALSVATDGVAQAKAELPANAPSNVVLMRSQASALNACGRPADAEPVLRTAIALQERVVAGGGTRMMALANDLAMTLNDLGRYQEAVQMLGRSDNAVVNAGLGKIDAAVSWINRSGILENAGDYPGALDAANAAIRMLDEDQLESDHQVRRRIERSMARTWGLAGEHERAWNKLVELRERSREIEGEDSGEFALLTWQLAVLAGRMKDAARGPPMLDEAQRRWAALVPSAHPVFVHVRRVRAVFAILSHDYASADRNLNEAIALLQGGSASPVDLAIARCELAELRVLQHRQADARHLLGVALPVLRSTVLPAEVSRVRAERLAIQLNFKL